MQDADQSPVKVHDVSMHGLKNLAWLSSFRELYTCCNLYLGLMTIVTLSQSIIDHIKLCLINQSINQSINLFNSGRKAHTDKRKRKSLLWLSRRHRPISAAIKVTSCKEMGGATSNACHSRTRSVSKRLIPSIRRYAVIGCGLQVASSCIILYAHNTMLMRAARLVQVVREFFQVLS